MFFTRFFTRLFTRFFARAAKSYHEQAGRNRDELLRGSLQGQLAKIVAARSKYTENNRANNVWKMLFVGDIFTHYQTSFA